MSLYCGTPAKFSAKTPRGKIRLRGEQDSVTVREVLTSPTRLTPQLASQLYYCDDEWATLGDSYGLEVDTERREEHAGFDFNNGRSFRERIRVKDSEKTLVGGEWGDQFRVAYINGEKPVLIQLKCKDDDLSVEEDETNNDNNNNNDNSRITNKSNMDDKDVYFMYYIEQENGE